MNAQKQNWGPRNRSTHLYGNDLLGLIKYPKEGEDDKIFGFSKGSFNSWVMEPYQMERGHWEVLRRTSSIFSDENCCWFLQTPRDRTLG